MRAPVRSCQVWSTAAVDHQQRDDQGQGTVDQATGHQPVGQVGHRDHHQHGEEHAERGQDQVPAEVGGRRPEQHAGDQGGDRGSGRGRSRGHQVPDRAVLGSGIVGVVGIGGGQGIVHRVLEMFEGRVEIGRPAPACRPARPAPPGPVDRPAAARPPCGCARPPAARRGRAPPRRSGRPRWSRRPAACPPHATYWTGGAERGIVGSHAGHHHRPDRPRGRHALLRGGPRRARRRPGRRWSWSRRRSGSTPTSRTSPAGSPMPATTPSHPTCSTGPATRPSATTTSASSSPT